MERIISRSPNVLSRHNTTGEADFLLQVAAKDLDGYGRFVETVLRNPPGVVSVTSNLPLRELKLTGRLPVAFSKKPDPGYRYRTMGDETLVITQGGQPLDAARAKRLRKPRNDRWEIAIDPASKEDPAVSIAATSDCEAAGAVCTENGEALSNAVSATSGSTSRGPCRAEDGRGA